MDLKHILEIGMEISKGFNVTLSIFFYTLLFSIPLGLILSVFSQSKNKVIYGVVRIYTWILRGTPLMLQIFFIYFGIPIMTGNTVIFDNYTAGLVGFILNYTAYFAEIFRGGIQGIDKGQYEAANALGLTYPKTMLKIVLPQAIRGSLPSIGNEAITLIKDTVLLAIISLKDILQFAKGIVSREATLTPFIIVAIFYLLMTFIITKIMKYLEKRCTIPN
ncbi:MAG: amino acid ABC transporter permease [Oscillospiraceae bacterium]